MAVAMEELAKIKAGISNILGSQRGRNVFGCTMAAAIAIDCAGTEGDVRENFDQTMELGWQLAMNVLNDPKKDGLQ